MTTDTASDRRRPRSRTPWWTAAVASSAMALGAVAAVPAAAVEEAASPDTAPIVTRTDASPTGYEVTFRYYAPEAPDVSPFADLDPTDPFYAEIAWLGEQAISTGWEDGTFRPGSTITRDAMAAFLYRFAHG